MNADKRPIRADATLIPSPLAGEGRACHVLDTGMRVDTSQPADGLFIDTGIETDGVAIVDGLVRNPKPVTPAEAGVQNSLDSPDVA
jgi:hypothetical protein